MNFYSDAVKFNAAQGEKQMITNAQGINYNFVLDDGSFNDQNYDIQAVSFCKVGSGLCYHRIEPYQRNKRYLQSTLVWYAAAGRWCAEYK